MVRSAVVVFAILAAGCAERSSQYAREVEPERPAGRFQMMPAPDATGEMILLDTRYGVVRRCWVSVTDKLEMACGDGSKALP